MKKLAKKFNVALIGSMASVAPAMAKPSMQGVCDLIQEMGGVFTTLRALAFIGAAFLIAAWAWDWISDGKVELKEVKTKGVGMLVGFITLFLLGTLITIVLSMASEGGSLGCSGNPFETWN